jgi:6-pyruvoyltetrahydropterin/6-carboxytetrahydropterin synthase
MITHRISVSGDRLRFAAGHFATYGGGLEPLHGHNYEITVHLDGDLTGDSWVMDFSELRRVAADICRELDHKFLLQGESRALEIRKDAGAYEVRFGDRRYVMPAGDVALLPLDNTTAERIAQWFAGRLEEALRAHGQTNVSRISVGVQEAPGQAGWYSRAVRAAP